jgi:hypothetical protein
MQTFWAFVETSNSGFIRVTVQANTWFEANEMLKAMYGTRLMSEAARG